MANRKISDLTALTAPATDDLLPIVDISEAAAADKNKKITYGTFLSSVPLGTAAAPSIAFTGDNTGIYSPGADQLAISTGGTSRLAVSTTAVSSTLAVVVPLGAVGTPSLTFTGDLNTGIWSPAADTIAFSEGGAEAMRIDSSGRLLVGTSSASSAGAYAQYGLIKTQGNSAASGGAAIVNIARGEGAATITSGEDLGAISFTDSAGNEFGTIICAADANAGAGDYPGRLMFSTTADGAASPTERMRIDSSGNVLMIGTSLSNLGTVNKAVYARNDGANANVQIANTITTSYAAITFFNGNGSIGSITTSGSATAFNTSSDYRLKENVAEVTDGITRLQQLKPSRFNFIADPDKTVDGFIAHEVQTVVPEAITGEKDAVDDDGNPVYQGIDQSKLVPLLTAALQEAIARIETLETEVAALKGA